MPSSKLDQLVAELHYYAKSPSLMLDGQIIVLYNKVIFVKPCSNFIFTMSSGTCTLVTQLLTSFSNLTTFYRGMNRDYACITLWRMSMFPQDNTNFTQVVVAGESSIKMNPSTRPLFECHSIHGSKIMNQLLSSFHNTEIFTVSLSVLQEVRMTVGSIFYLQIPIWNDTDDEGVFELSSFITHGCGTMAH